jgi:hypothetical protein
VTRHPGSFLLLQHLSFLLMAVTALHRPENELPYVTGKCDVCLYICLGNCSVPLTKPLPGELTYSEVGSGWANREVSVVYGTWGSVLCSQEPE